MKYTVYRVLVFVLLCATLSAAQTTSVTVNVADTDAQAWANGTYEFDFYTPPGVPNNGTFIFNGATMSTFAYSGSLNGSGTATVSLPDNTFITPSGTQWNLQVCPQSTSPCFTEAFTVSGLTQTINITPPAVRVGPLSRIAAYKDSEIVSPFIGNCYYNLTDLSTHCYNGIVWVAGGGGGGGSVNSATAPSSLFQTPITPAGGVLGFNFVTNFPANDVLGNCTGVAATPGPCALASAMIPAVNLAAGNVNGGATGVLPVGNLPFTYTGNTTKLVTGGTITGTSALLCTDASGNATTSGCPGASSVNFSGILTGTNSTATMTVGAGGSLTFTSTGIVNASQYQGINTVTATEFGFVHGVTSAIQTQLNALLPASNPTYTGTLTLSGGGSGCVQAAAGAFSILSSNCAVPVGASTLQYDNAGAFGSVTGSAVSGANLSLGGSFTVNGGATSFTGGLVNFSTSDVNTPGLTIALPLNTTKFPFQVTINGVQEFGVDFNGVPNIGAPNASSSSMIFTTGTAPTTPGAGWFWYVAPNFSWSDGTNNYTVAANNLANVFIQPQTVLIPSATSTGLTLQAATSQSVPILAVNDHSGTLQAQVANDFGMVAHYFKTSMAGAANGSEEFSATGVDPATLYAMDPNSIRLEAASTITTSFREILPNAPATALGVMTTDTCPPDANSVPLCTLSLTDKPTVTSLTLNGGNVDLVQGADVTEIPNASTTGTTINLLAKLTGAPSTAVKAATTDTDGIVGVVVGGAGIAGSAQIARSGQASCVFDNATVAGDYVQISSSTAGDCHDAGATRPASGQILGRVLVTNALTAQLNNMTVFTGIAGSSGGGGSGTVNSGTLGQLAWYAASGTTLSGNANVTASAGALTLGVASTTAGQLLLNGGTSGTVTLQTAAAAGTYNFNLPTSSGASGQPLLSGGGGTTSETWGSVTGNTTTFATCTGALTGGDFTSFDNSGNCKDSLVAVFPSIPVFSTTASGSNVTGTASSNIKLWQIYIPYPGQFGTITYRTGSTADNTTNSYDLGIYGPCGPSSTCNLLGHIGTTPGTTFAPTASTDKSLSLAAGIQVVPGNYYVALTTNCTTACATLSGGVAFTKQNGQIITGGGAALPASITSAGDAPTTNATIPSITLR